MNRLIALFCSMLLWSCNDSKTYQITIISDHEIKLDGEEMEQVWQQAEEFSAFTNPWNSAVAPSTTLKLLKDSEFLYFYFAAEDNEIVINDDFLVERDVEKEDRVELFFSKDADMKQYYCFEIDALARTLSYGARHYRQMDFEWDVPVGYQVQAILDEDGYRVEGAIPLTFIDSLSTNNSVYFGAYRAEFSRKNGSLVENWLTWVNPKTPSPDFHVPSSLGKITW